jgi:hypothetical protein
VKTPLTISYYAENSVVAYLPSNWRSGISQSEEVQIGPFEKGEQYCIIPSKTYDYMLNHIEFEGVDSFMVSDIYILDKNSDSIVGNELLRIIDILQSLDSYIEDDGLIEGYNKGTGEQRDLLISNNIIGPTDEGFNFFDTGLEKELYLHVEDRGTEESPRYLYWFMEYDRATAGVYRSGYTRPSASLIYIGFSFFDRSINKVIYAKEITNGVVTWVESDGAVAGVLRTGPFSSKPTPSNIYYGFQYFNTDTHKNITYGGNYIWYNPDGTEATE